MPTHFTESEVEIAALDWFAELSFDVVARADIAPLFRAFNDFRG